MSHSHKTRKIDDVELNVECLEVWYKNCIHSWGISIATNGQIGHLLIIVRDGSQAKNVED